MRILKRNQILQLKCRDRQTGKERSILEELVKMYFKTTIMIICNPFFKECISINSYPTLFHLLNNF